MATLTILILAAIIANLAWTFAYGGRAPKPYRDRSCQGRQWRARFPDAAKAEIRSFLSLFAEGFAFRPSEKLKFEPNDELLKIYQAIYPVKDWPDAMEFETLQELFEKRYSVPLACVWHDRFTLGELFEMAKRK